MVKRNTPWYRHLSVLNRCDTTLSWKIDLNPLGSVFRVISASFNGKFFRYLYYTSEPERSSPAPWYRVQRHLPGLFLNLNHSGRHLNAYVKIHSNPSSRLAVQNRHYIYKIIFSLLHSTCTLSAILCTIKTFAMFVNLEWNIVQRR